ncbi:oligopeptide:H+ symporter [Paenibacillus kribbensis]|uniref:peptide MFS transporter n=1 Tax=Paenibacillus kribbensis TaxID=172713 RepID=UPI002DBD03F6|nr:oligopeptide:H+ symporter [Paenibacillus kribbensis]MEC0233924.1 oligopeptide:H+ symporter [Paenibacillus kribbensis]
MNDELQHGPGSNNARLEVVLDDSKFFGHPRGVGALAAGNFFNSFAWGALYAILIFYLYSPFTKGLEFTQGQAASMVTAMGACNSIFVILGSWLADRVLGLRKALIIGNIIKGTAFGLLAIPAFSLTQGRIFAFIALFLMSLPIMGASNASLTGQLYRKTDNGRRDAAFTIHTIANNIAGLVAPVLVGQIGMKNYHIGFLIAAVAAFLYGAVIFFTQHKFFGPLGEKPIKPLEEGKFRKIFIRFMLVLIVLIGTIVALVLAEVISFQGVLNIITSATFIIPIVFLTNLLSKKDLTALDRRRMKPFLKLFAAQIVMALCGVMLTSTVAIFIDQKIDRKILGFEVAPGSVGTIYTVLGLVLAPVFVWLWTKTRATHIRTTYKYGLGIIFSALGYGLLTIPIVLFKDQAPYSLLWMVFYYLFLTFSDNLVWPIGSSLVAKLSPEAYDTQMQTAWGQAGTIGNGIALILFSFYQTADQQVNLFPIMTGLLLVTALLIFGFSKNIEKDMV